MTLNEVILYGISFLNLLVLWYNARGSAKKDQFAFLDGEIKILQGQLKFEREAREKSDALVRTLREELNTERDAREKVEGEILDVREWAEALIEQVKAAGKDPIPFRPSRLTGHRNEPKA